MSNGDIVVNLLLSPTELNFLQVAVDNLIDVQRDVIHTCVNDLHDLDVDRIQEAIERLDAGFGLKQTLELFNP